MCKLNGYSDTPTPGSFVCTVCQPDNPSGYVWTVVACKKDTYPGPWDQYEMTLLLGGRILHLSIESVEFHNNWHVLHRP